MFIFHCLQPFPYPKSLVNTFCSSLGSTLLHIENTTIDPLHLWVIKKRFLAPLPGSVALLVSEVGKEPLLCVAIFILLLPPSVPMDPSTIGSLLVRRRPTTVVVTPTPT